MREDEQVKGKSVERAERGELEKLNKTAGLKLELIWWVVARGVVCGAGSFDR